ncbi:MAG: benzoate-CoA ligase family protein [Actinobacteria bacterium]|nr:MAG: benzoate-CoA ligase family protein [Actinomycetota bacterium]
MTGPRGDASALPPYNATVDLLERNLTPGRAERTYLITHERTWSYAEMAASADGAGAGLLDLGLTRGDRVIVAMRDRAEFVSTFWGAMKAGLVPVPVPEGLSAPDLRFILADSEARAIVCDPASARTVSEARQEGVACLIAEGSAHDGVLGWSDVCGKPLPLEPAQTNEEDIALWLYTSGTTGLPKAVMHRHRDLGAAPHALAEQIIGLSSEDVVLSASKMYFAYGLGNQVYLPASVGAAVVVNQAPMLAATLQSLLVRKRPTVLFGVPAFFSGFAREPDTELPSSVRMALSAGEALAIELFELFQRRFGLPLLDGLGSTEALHHVTCNRPDDIVLGSVGPPLDGYEVQALDRDRQPVPEGESGELWLRGPTTFAGYWRRPELTARAYLGDWIRTGDLVRITDGRVFHHGRLDDLIKVGGVWMAPVEVEDVLRGHPDVIDAAVVATDDREGVPVLRAFVVSRRKDADLGKELKHLCRRRLATFKVPKFYEMVDELPRTPTGKLQRFILRTPAGQRGRSATD